MSDQELNPIRQDARQGEQGFLLVGVIVLIALVLIALSVAAPVVAKDLRREKELEAVHRGQQYTHAIRLYYLKFNSYPSSVKLLEGGAPKERYLRQHYLDPFTGKDDWKLIGLGQAKTTVKGFFGQPLGGLPGATGGLGGASSLQSSGFGNTSSTTGGSGATTAPGGAAGDQSGAGTSGFGASSFGQSGSGIGSGSGSSGGSNSPFESGTTGPFVGVGLPKEGASVITLNEQTDYSKWEFIYDPRIEQLYAKASIFGGGISTSNGGLGSPSSLNGSPGAPSGSNPNNNIASPPGSPPAGGGANPTNPPTSTPQ